MKYLLLGMLLLTGCGASKRMAGDFARGASEAAKHPPEKIECHSETWGNVTEIHCTRTGEVE